MPVSSKAAAGELHLQFQLGDDRYALPASQVVEVLPLRRLKQVPEAPQWVAGLFEHRNRVTPVIDLSRRVLGRPALPAAVRGWCWCASTCNRASKHRCSG